MGITTFVVISALDFLRSDDQIKFISSIDETKVNIKPKDNEIQEVQNEKKITKLNQEIENEGERQPEKKEDTSSKSDNVKSNSNFIKKTDT